MFGRIPRVRQRDITDCGAACLASVAAHYGLTLPLSRIRQVTGTDRQGTSALGLVEGASRLGFQAKGVRGGPDSLPRIPKPAIAHMILEGNRLHYVVVYRVTRRRIWIMDPIDGRVHRRPHAEFTALWTGVLVILVPADDFRPRRERRSTAARLLDLVRPHRTAMLQAFLGSAIYVALGLSITVYVQQVVDSVIPDGNRTLLDLLGIGMMLILGAQMIVGALRRVLALRVGQAIDAALILGYYRHLLTLPQRFFDTMRVGEIISRVNDAVRIRAFVNDVLPELFVNALVLVLSLLAICLYSRALAALVLGLVPAYVLVYTAMNVRNRATQRRLMESAADLEAHLVESLGAVATIKRAGAAWFANLRTEMRFVRVLRAVYASSLNALGGDLASAFVGRLASVLLLWVGAVLVLRQELTPGALMSCYALVGFLTPPVAAIIGMNRVMQDALIAADRLYEIMDLEREGGPRLDLVGAAGPALVDADGDLRLENVSFRYGTRQQVFERLDLTIRRRQLTAVVGESGSGKSTLAALIQGVYPLAHGRIRLGEADLAYLPAERLRRLIGVVPQQVDIFSGSVLENIAFGDAEPDLPAVSRLCDLLELTPVVAALPEGLLTAVGERGVTLSGGQRQRIAIARALYRRPDVLILDEATSSLDAIAERAVHRAIGDLVEGGVTVIVIAHRLSAAVQASTIVVLDSGRVVEEGTHGDLVEREGAYHRLWCAQTGFVPAGGRPPVRPPCALVTPVGAE